MKSNKSDTVCLIFSVSIMLFWLLVIDLIYDETLYVSLAEGILISVRNLYPCRGYYDFCQKLATQWRRRFRPQKVCIFWSAWRRSSHVRLSVCPSDRLSVSLSVRMNAEISGATPTRTAKGRSVLMPEYKF